MALNHPRLWLKEEGEPFLRKKEKNIKKKKKTFYAQALSIQWISQQWPRKTRE